jgi:hypothetical protein
MWGSTVGRRSTEVGFPRTGVHLSGDRRGTVARPGRSQGSDSRGGAATPSILRITGDRPGRGKAILVAQFKFDERAIKKLTDQAVRQVADESNRLFAQLGRQYRGKPVSVIKPALKRAWERNGGKITDPRS